jgi:hypothetical protein
VYEAVGGDHGLASVDLTQVADQVRAFLDSLGS